VNAGWSDTLTDARVPGCARVYANEYNLSHDKVMFEVIAYQ